MYHLWEEKKSALFVLWETANKSYRLVRASTRLQLIIINVIITKTTCVCLCVFCLLLSNSVQHQFHWLFFFFVYIFIFIFLFICLDWNRRHSRSRTRTTLKRLGNCARDKRNPLYGYLTKRHTIYWHWFYNVNKPTSQLNDNRQ